MVWVSKMSFQSWEAEGESLLVYTRTGREGEIGGERLYNLFVLVGPTHLGGWQLAIVSGGDAVEL